MFLDHVVEEDREAVEATLADAHATVADRAVNVEFECRMRRDDGAVRWIQAQGTPPVGHGIGPGGVGRAQFDAILERDAHEAENWTWLQPYQQRVLEAWVVVVVEVVEPEHPVAARQQAFVNGCSHEILPRPGRAMAIPSMANSSRSGPPLGPTQVLNACIAWKRRRVVRPASVALRGLASLDFFVSKILADWTVATPTCVGSTWGPGERRWGRMWSGGLMDIQVTGGAGYIGCHGCVALAERGDHVVIADNFANSTPLVLLRLRKVIGAPVACERVDLRH